MKIMTKRSIAIFFLLASMSILSCHSSKKEQKQDLYWDEIEIQTKNQTVKIYQETDTVSVEKEILKKISGNGFSAKYKLDKIEKKIFRLNSVKRDSLSKAVYRVMTKPVFPNTRATCYAGYALIKLRNGIVTLSCEYESAGEWEKVSDDTKKIYDILEAMK